MVNGESALPVSRRRVLQGTGVAGILGLGYLSRGATDPNADDLFERMIARYGDSDHDLYVRQHYAYDAPEELQSVERTRRIWYDPPGRQRSVTVDSTHEAQIGRTRVIDGIDKWTYDGSGGSEHENHVIAYRERDGKELDVGAVAHYERLLDDWAFEYAGRDEIAGWETHLIRAEPLESAVDGASLIVAFGETEYEITLDREGPEELLDPGDAVDRTVWLHADLLYPVREEMEMLHPDDDDETITITWYYDELAVNEGIQDDKFTLDPPQTEELVVIETLGWGSEYGTVAEAESATPFELLTPDLPGRFDLETVVVRKQAWQDRSDTTSARQWYRAEDEDERLALTISQHRSTLPIDDEISIDGVPVSLSTNFGQQSLIWEGGGLSYRLSSHGDRELLTTAVRPLVVEVDWSTRG